MHSHVHVAVFSFQHSRKPGLATLYSMYACVRVRICAHICQCACATQMMLARQLCRVMGSLDAPATGSEGKGGLHKMCLHLQVISWRRGAGALQECGCIGDVAHVGPSDIYVFTCARCLQAHISTVYKAVGLLPAHQACLRISNALTQAKLQVRLHPYVTVLCAC